jgi:hypothetical protein
MVVTNYAIVPVNTTDRLPTSWQTTNHHPLADELSSANSRQLLLAMSNPGSHASLLTTDLPSPPSRFLYTHEHTLLISREQVNLLTFSMNLLYKNLANVERPQTQAT